MRHAISEDERRRFSALLTSAQRGDADARGALCRRHYTWIERRIRARLSSSLRSKCDACDVAQDVFAALLRRLPELRDCGEPAFRGLLAMMADNVMRSALRHHLGRGGVRLEKPAGEDIDQLAMEPAAVPTVPDDMVKLRRLVAALGPMTALILRMRMDGRSFSAIADATGLHSADAARKRHARALTELRRKWRASSL